MQSPLVEKIIGELNSQQVEAVTLGKEHSLVLAGAGSGKTKVIISRAAFLINSGIRPERIRILTFTRRSAVEIIDRVKLQLGETAKGLGASTFHAWLLQLLHEAPNAFGIPKTFTIIDQDDQTQLFKSLRGKRKSKEFPSASELASVFSFVMNTGKPFEKVCELKLPEFYGNRDDIRDIMNGYVKKKREGRYIDYDDVLTIVGRAINKSPKVKNWIASKIDYLLIDESQDTNWAQWQIVTPLQNDVTIMAVGDDCQSIYGWRGADVSSIHNFSSIVKGAKTIKLFQNYRSTQEILDVSNWLLKESPLNYDKDLLAARGSGKPPVIRDFYNDWQEADWLSDDLILRHHEHDKPWRDHMVLVRSGFAGRCVESLFLEKGVPYRFVGGSKLLESAHIKDLLCVLRIVANRHDEIAWMRFLSQWPGVGDTKASKIIDSINSVVNESEIAKSLHQNKNLNSDSACFIYDTAYENRDNVAKAIRQTFLAMEPFLEARYRNKEWSKREKDFEILETIASKHTSILAFIEDYLMDPLTSSQINTEEAEDVVTLITIHSAKGTECPVCYVLNISPGSFPSAMASVEEEEEEERRVLYVALTRPKDELIMTRRGYLPPPGTLANKQYDCDNRYFFQGIPAELFDYYPAGFEAEEIFN